MISNRLEQLQNTSAHIFPIRFLRPCFRLCLHFVQAIPHPEMDRPPGSPNTSGRDQPVLYSLYLEINKPNQGCEKSLTTHNAYADASLAAINLTGKHSRTLVILLIKVLRGMF